MSGICGWFDRDGSGPAAPTLAGMTAPLTRFDRSAVRTASAAFGAVAAAGGDGDVFQDGERLVAVWGKVRFTDKELASLAGRHGTAHALAHGYEAKGSGVLAALSGEFALAILNRRRGEALLAVDRIGTRPLCYCIAGGRLVFGSSLDAIDAFPGSAAGIDRQAIYDYVYFHMVP